jgi:L-fuculose-phosphate aldolase
MTEDAREEMVASARELLDSGLVLGTAGNLGARLPDGNVVVTPSSVDYRTMTVDDLVVCSLDGTIVDGHRPPTSELALHLAAFRAHDDIGATIHCHAKFATMFAVARQPVPAIVEEFVVYVGGDVPVAEYRTTGTEELAAEIARHLDERSAVLMANHGLFTIGRDLPHALHVAELVERTAEIVWGARALGPPASLPEDTTTTFASYYRIGRGLAG